MASIEDRDRLLDNSKGDVTIDILLTLEAGSNFRHSTEALVASQTVQHVTIEVHSTFQSRWQNESEIEDILAFFRAIGCLPKLKSLMILARSFGIPVKLPALLLTEALQHARMLERFKIHGIVLQIDSIQEELDFAAAFENHPSLLEISFVRSLFQGSLLVESEIGEANAIYHAPFREFFAALATIPRLESLGIHYREKDSGAEPSTTRLSSTVLSNFSQISKLMQLEVFNCELNDDHLEALAEHFASFDSLQELSLSCQKFGLRSCQAIAQMLSLPSPLAQLYLEPKKGSLVADAHLIADALADNQESMLLSFVLEGPLVVGLESFVKMMRVNYRLETLTIKTVMPSHWHQLELDYLLKLNEIGRYKLFHNTPTPRSMWMEAIAASEADIHCLFYLLSANPSLCSI